MAVSLTLLPLVNIACVFKGFHIIIVVQVLVSNNMCSILYLIFPSSQMRETKQVSFGVILQ